MSACLFSGLSIARLWFVNGRGFIRQRQWNTKARGEALDNNVEKKKQSKSPGTLKTNVIQLSKVSSQRLIV